MAKVQFEFDDKRIANLFVIKLEGGELEDIIVDKLNEYITEYNNSLEEDDEQKGDLIDKIEYLDIDIDNDEDPTHIVTIN